MLTSRTAGTLASKCAEFAASLLCASLLIFFIISLTPGDIAEIHSLSPATVERLHLDEALWRQYLSWLAGAVRFDFGISLLDGEPVQSLLATYAGTTLVLTLGSLLCSLLLSVPIGLLLGLSPQSRLWQGVTSVVYGLSSTPVFVVGYILLALVFGIFEFYPLDRPAGEFGFWPWAAYYLLPVLVLAVGNGTLGEFVRVLSLEIRSVNATLYVKAARARGGPLLIQFWRPVVLPFLSVIIARFAVLMGGVIVVERIFNRHGLGWLTWEATLNRDFYVIMSVTLVTAFCIRVLMLAHDLLSYLLDPRLRV